MAASRYVSCHIETVIGMFKSRSPVVKLDKGVDWPATSQIKIDRAKWVDMCHIWMAESLC